MNSIWDKTAELPHRAALTGDKNVQVAVIGGGLAGILTAYLLQKAGRDVVVLEAARVGGGQTGNTTAKLTSQHGLIYQRLLLEQGAEKARQYGEMNQAALGSYRRMIAEERIACHYEACPAYLYSTADGDALRREAEAAALVGLPASFTAETLLPFPVAGAVRFENQAQFHPLEFLRAVSQKLTVYEDTPVRRAEGNRLYTDGGVVTADHVVFATHYPFPTLRGLYIARMYQERSYVLALENAQQLDGVYLGVGEDGLSFRNYENLLLLGGGSHRTGENSGGRRYDALWARAKELWPDSREAARWSAQDCMTLDGIPYIGRLCVTTPDWSVATGFNKWGMTGSMAAAMLLTDRICGRENPNGQVFDPQRLDLAPSMQEFALQGGQAVKGLSRRLFSLPRGDLDALPPGHGGVVECDGEKAGVYKDEEGKIFVVSVRCPHLGCQLEWNPDEKSWDCPCHGSRFDYRGALLDGPAQESIEVGKEKL